MAHKIHVTAVIWKEGTRYVSRCPEVGVSSFGKTPSAARKALNEATSLWFSNVRKLGILDDI